MQLALEGLVQVGSEVITTGNRHSAKNASYASNSGAQPTAKAPKIIPDNRTNSFVVIATPIDMASAENLITKLDIPTPEGVARFTSIIWPMPMPKNWPRSSRRK